MGKKSPPLMVRHKSAMDRARRQKEDPRILQIGLRIKKARADKGWSQHALALRLGVTAGAVGQWEIGANRPQMRTFEKIAEALGVSRDWLLTGEDERERGIAQDVHEKRLLQLARQMPADARAVFVSLMENWSVSEIPDPELIRAVFEQFVGLPRTARRHAAVMIDGLSRLGPLLAPEVDATPCLPDDGQKARKTRKGAVQVK
jgi:transcriptional regulator with XRE-family HTH domain